MDMKKMYGYVSEALRFNPVQPGVIRFSETKQELKRQGHPGIFYPCQNESVCPDRCCHV